MTKKGVVLSFLSFGTGKYDYVIKTKEIFSFLPVINNSMTTGWSLLLPITSAILPSSTIITFCSSLGLKSYQCCCRHHSYHLSIQWRPLGHWNAVGHLLLYVVLCNDHFICIFFMNPWHAKRFHQYLIGGLIYWVVQSFFFAQSHPPLVSYICGQECLAIVYYVFCGVDCTIVYFLLQLHRS